MAKITFETNYSNDRENTQDDFLKMLHDENEWRQSSWQEIHSEGIKYINDNYLSKHPNEIPLDRLEQIKRNMRRWKNQLISIDPNYAHPENWKYIEFLDSNLLGLEERIEFLKSQRKTDAHSESIVIRNEAEKPKTRDLEKYIRVKKYSDTIKELKNLVERKEYFKIGEYISKNKDSFYLFTIGGEHSVTNFIKILIPESQNKKSITNSVSTGYKKAENAENVEKC